MIFCLDARSATNHFPGIGRYVSSLSQALARQLAPDETLLLLHDPDEPSRWALPVPGPQVEWLPVQVSPFGPAQQWRLPLTLYRRRIAVYHAPYYLMPYTLRLPTILTFHDAIPLHIPDAVSRRARLLFRLTTRLALRRSAHVIAVSEASRRDLIQRFRFPARRVTTVLEAPDPGFRPPTPAAIAAVRDYYRLPADYWLTLCSNKPHKNLVRLVEAWHAAGEPGRLVIAGPWDPRYDAPKTRAAELSAERIHFLGPVDETDLPALYGGATAFLFPSLYEGFGLPVLEAMACGTPVACANRTSLPEVAGDAALLFEPASTAAITETIQQLAQDARLREDLAARGRTRAAQFSWDRAAAETLAVYRSVANFGKKENNG